MSDASWIKWRLAPSSDPEQRWIVTTADGEEEICGVIGNESHADVLAASKDLLLALKGIWALIDSGQLCRNFSDDALPGWAMRQIPLLMTLKAAGAAIARAEGR